MSWLKKTKEFFFGKPEKNYQQSTLGPEQQDLYAQLEAAGISPGAGGAFGESADYYRDLLSDNSQTYDMLAAPEMRRFNEEVIPGVGEEFAGMGAGGLSSSGFRNSLTKSGTELTEKLGNLRQQLRMSGAQGIQNIGNIGLGQYNENIHRPQTSGFINGAIKGYSSSLFKGGGYSGGGGGGGGGGG